jgi:signal transduction histidine kinase
LAYAARAVLNNATMVKEMEAAANRAMEREAEADAKRAEAERANLAKSEFLTTMTHELRTPLNAVIGYSEIIGEDMEAEGRADLAGDAKRINGAARHLLGLIDQILQLSAVDADRSELQLGDVDVRALVEAAVQAATPSAQVNNSRISTRFVADISGAYTDGEKLGVCVSQLLSNAVKFTANGLVAISVDREGAAKSPWLRIVVSDTGIGMAPEELEKAFQPFSQIDGSMTREHGGMGLGLSITLRTAKALGGEVVAVSERGAGSTFTLRVPMRLRAPDGSENTPDPAHVAGVGAAA